MDGQQIAGPNGNVSLITDEMINDSLGQSVLLLDSDGCPTDANIMGQLVKMDSTGRRLLAPFDAFKFPSSDVVFFRAVISTCVAECRPVTCHASSPLSAYSAIPTNPLDFTSSDRLSNHSITTTRTLPSSSQTMTTASLSSGPTPQFVRSTADPTTSARIFDSLEHSDGFSLSFMASTLPPVAVFENKTTTNGPMAINVTVASLDTLSTIASIVSQSNEESAVQSIAQALNLTNNHQLGQKMTPPRRTTPHVDELSTKLPPLSIDLLGESQRDQLVKLFTETRQRFAQAVELTNSTTHRLDSHESKAHDPSDLSYAENSALDEDSRLILAKLDTIINYLESNDSRTRDLNEAILIPDNPNRIHEEKRSSPLVESSENELTSANQNFDGTLKLSYEQQLNELHREARMKSGQEQSSIRPKRETNPQTTRIYHEQVQSGLLEPTIAAKLLGQQEARFSRSLVEMYHTARQPRIRRQADKDSPSLLVQSIKIVDRLEFSDQEKQQTSRQQRARQSLLTGSKWSSEQSKKYRLSSDSKVPIAEPIGDDSSGDSKYLASSNWGTMSLILVAAMICFVSLQLLLFALFALANGHLGPSSKPKPTVGPTFASNASVISNDESVYLDSSGPSSVSSSQNEYSVLSWLSVPNSERTLGRRTVGPPFGGGFMAAPKPTRPSDSLGRRGAEWPPLRVQHPR